MVVHLDEGVHEFARTNPYHLRYSTFLNLLLTFFCLFLGDSELSGRLSAANNDQLLLWNFDEGDDFLFTKL